QQMGTGMIGADGGAARMIDIELQRHAELERALLHGAEMHEEIAGLLLRLGDAEADALAGQDSDVADLTAGLAVERRLVQDDSAGLTGLQRVGLLAILDQSGDR